jgi:hypothetical protein
MHGVAAPTPQHVIGKLVTDWEPVKKAFVERRERVPFDELAAEFGLPPARVRVRSSDEGWPVARAQYHEAQMLKADAAAVVVAAAKNETLVFDTLRTLALLAFRGAIADLEAMAESGDELDKRKRMALRQDASFMALNFANALRGLGLSGIAKNLDAKDDATWQSGVLVQINNLVGATVGSPAAKSVIETAEKSVR